MYYNINRMLQLINYEKTKRYIYPLLEIYQTPRYRSIIKMVTKVYFCNSLIGLTLILTDYFLFKNNI